ncbi:hypothetical protein FSP39_013516 [Pinctada imbricata]|uniref:Isochorismatase-like domain-containing protein n=1 Tax=Pinctada imbricata TaxID=66713 RepID=A0AA88XRV4_PINIB|nr:hypothetical protein FSP39_013516 [Pinctada imbricata]
MMVPEVRQKLGECCDGDVQHVVIFGVETHVCIQQTVIDLLKEERYAVHVIADGCTSRTQMDRKFALERFRHMGAIVTTSDAMLQQLIGGKDHPKFKDVQQLIKLVAPDSGL